MDIKQTLEFGVKLLKENKIDEPILKAKLLLASILGKSKEYLILNEKQILSKNTLNEYEKSIDKLLMNIPVQYITNKQEFMGIEFYIDENVLIPQPDTEILTEEVIDIIKKENKKYILDLCTGSGAIGVSIAKRADDTNVILSDISNKALDVARKNCIMNNVNIKIVQSDLFKNIKGKFDIIVSNPPYVKSAVIKTLNKEVQNEPKIALDGGEDGLKFYREIIKNAYKFLNENGYLCLEIGYDQKDEVITLIRNCNKYADIYSKKDLANNDRIIICKKLSKKH